MKKNIAVFIMFFCLFILPYKGFSYEFEIVKGLYETDFSVTSESCLKVIYAASENFLFKKSLTNEKWQKVSRVGSQDSNINYIYVDKDETVYTATTSGLFKSKLQEVAFKRIFRGTDENQDNVYIVKVIGGVICIGTGNGFFYSDIDSENWKKLRVLPEGTKVFWIEKSPLNKGILYLASDNGVYVIKNNFKESKKVFFCRKTDISETDENYDEYEDAEQAAFIPHVIKFYQNNPDIIYLGTSDGLFISQDSAKTWKKTFPVRVGRAFIKNIIQIPEEKNLLFLITNRGFFKINVKDNTVNQIYKGLTTNDINYAVYNNGQFILATNKGLFESKKNVRVLSLAGQYKEHFKYEPTIGEIQNATIEYNDISSEKIKHWQEISKKKAWFPELKISAGGDTNETYEIYTSASTNYSVLGPDYDKFNWDVSLDWDLGDLIWSTNQTSIDTRSRLNTQLRIDILEEVNRLYFERYRLKIELFNMSSENTKAFMDKQLRLEELTAAIDFYTGGYFTKRSRELMMAEK